MPVPHSPNQNHLLAAMPAAAFERVFPHLELVEMPLGEVLYESGGQLQHVYFPTTSIVSLLYVWRTVRLRRSPSSATRAFSAFRCSWAGKPRRVGRWSRVRATVIG